MHLYFLLFPHLLVSSSWFVLIQVLCIDQNVFAQGVLNPHLPAPYSSLYLFMWHSVLLPHPAQCFTEIQMFQIADTFRLLKHWSYARHSDNTINLSYQHLSGCSSLRLVYVLHWAAITQWMLNKPRCFFWFTHSTELQLYADGMKRAITLPVALATLLLLVSLKCPWPHRNCLTIL